MAINERRGTTPPTGNAGGYSPVGHGILRTASGRLVAAQKVSFGTSGHRGSAFHSAFNEDHILAITQAICEYRAGEKTYRPALPGQGHACAFRTRIR